MMLASERQLLPVTWAFAGVYIFTIKYACHRSKAAVESKNVKLVGWALLQRFKWRPSNSSAAVCASAG